AFPAKLALRRGVKGSRRAYLAFMISAGGSWRRRIIAARSVAGVKHRSVASMSSPSPLAQPLSGWERASVQHTYSAARVKRCTAKVNRCCGQSVVDYSTDAHAHNAQEILWERIGASMSHREEPWSIWHTTRGLC